MPVLYLPVNKRVEFVLNSRDVIHSFWVPAFMMKMDILPGKTNKFQLTPTQVGTFQGKCAELCGAYHSQMLFMVKVVPQAEYDQEMAHLQVHRPRRPHPRRRQPRADGHRRHPDNPRTGPLWEQPMTSATLNREAQAPGMTAARPRLAKGRRSSSG